MSINIKNADGTLTKISGNTMNHPVNNISASDSIQDAPVGHILSYMGNRAPAHYLICDGAEYNIADYLDLANHFKNEFGSISYFGGDGVSTFAVPDLRGEFLRGAGENSHENQGSGATVGEHQDGTTSPLMATQGSTNISIFDRDSSSGGINLSDNRDFDFEITKNYYRLLTGSRQESTKTITAHTSRPTNTSVLYCIKYEPTYFMECTAPFALGVDDEGNYGYYKAGADTLTPFKSSNFDGALFSNQPIIGRGIIEGKAYVIGRVVTNRTYSIQDDKIVFDFTSNPNTFVNIWPTFQTDLTNIKTIKIPYQVTYWTGTGYRGYLYISTATYWDVPSQKEPANVVKKSDYMIFDNQEHELVLDVSTITGSYYVGLYFGADDKGWVKDFEFIS